ncbi:LOW QUALITY PROTEIN: hypothetical protein CVT26_005845 [Gymnopilus dilepis]|uniref:HCNGP-domain-containing protein n=1 Tax=Gymnopilus dilepis TaxID=231916 RepID=A0A409WG11_9AGAR|nr:LOW QUALITY PROTEIN: hypothetical protein CVT26_005845 [Gymnopilus dilepis]
MNGLVAYDYDSPSDTEAGPSTTNGARSSQIQNTNVRSLVAVLSIAVSLFAGFHFRDKSSKGGIKTSSEGRRIQKSQVIIKKPAISHKNPRVHITDEIQNEQTPRAGSSLTESVTEQSSPSASQPPPPGLPADELSQIRALLRPPPIPGVEDWGIPPETTAKCEPALQTQFTRFGNLKIDPMKPMHYNDNLMGNRTFRNPHLYAKLVDWVDVDERSTNFPKDIWDPEDVKPEWFADQIADAQKERSEKQAAAQAPGKRSHIDFSSSTSKDRTAPPRKSRFQPYGAPGPASATQRQKTRWG